MDALGKDFLSRPRFPFNEDVHVPKRHFLGKAKGFPKNA